MQNLFNVLLIFVGLAVALFVALVVLHSNAPPSSEVQGTKNEALIPQEIEGFSVERIDRVDPIFDGELFSVHASFAPKADSSFQGLVENLGITLFILENPRAADEIKPLLLMGDSGEQILEGVHLQSFSNPDARLAGLLWQDGVKLYYVLVAGIDSGDLNMTALQQAAQAAAKAILRRK